MSDARAPVPIALVGIGKIARDQHVPTLAAGADFRLAGVVSQHGAELGVPAAATLPELKAQVPDLAAVSLCTPPSARWPLIREALDLGLHVMVEKPPAATLGEAGLFADAARAAGRSLFLTWHSREASGVEPMRRWLADHPAARLRVEWMEDVRVWHPGQEWIWDPGVGVFDPGINALSILTRLLPGPVLVRDSVLRFPANRAAPIAADLKLDAADGAGVEVFFSFDQRGPQTWTIAVEAVDGARAELRDGGARFLLDGAEQPVPDGTEYGRLYARFAELVRNGGVDADLSPFWLVADAFLLGRRETAAPFDWNS